MAWYPGATRMLLLPEATSQPSIRPTQLILHSIVAPWTARRTYEYWRDSSSLESHFGLGYTRGDLGQYLSTTTRADANYAANRRPDGTGAISVETASNTSATDPWNAWQLDALVALGVWAHRTHGIPLRVCRTADDPGIGYHSLHRAWSTSGTACPGPERIRQFREVLLPRMRAAVDEPVAPTSPEETTVPLTKDDYIEIARHVWQRDGLIRNPNPATAERNTHIAGGTAVRNIEIITRRIERTLAAQDAVIAQLVAALAERDAIVDPDALIARIRSELERITITLSTED